MKHAPCNHEEGYCAMSQEIRLEDYLWAIRSQKYVTLIANNHPEYTIYSPQLPADMDVTVLVEAANYGRHSYLDLYRPIAFVLRLTVKDGDVTTYINSTEVDFQYPGFRDDALIEIVREAAEIMKVGQGYFSDPDAS